jgi:c-di-GMP-binding flagellar brake protein YcgR
MLTGRRNIFLFYINSIISYYTDSTVYFYQKHNVAHKVKPTDTIDRLNRNLSLLQAGATITFDIATPAGQRGKFRTCFIGYLPKQYILVQYPNLDRLGKYASHIKQGLNVTVRGLIEGHEGAVVAFTSQIRQTIQLPSKIIVLDFPEQVILQSLRNSIRIDLNINSVVAINNERWRASIHDISISGCQIFVHNGEQLVLTNDSQIEIAIEEYLNLYSLKFLAVICNVKQLSNGVSLGVKFLEQSKDEVKQLLHSAITSEA